VTTVAAVAAEPRGRRLGCAPGLETAVALGCRPWSNLHARSPGSPAAASPQPAPIASIAKASSVNADCSFGPAEDFVGLSSHPGRG